MLNQQISKNLKNLFRFPRAELRHLGIGSRIYNTLEASGVNVRTVNKC